MDEAGEGWGGVGVGRLVEVVQGDRPLQDPVYGRRSESKRAHGEGGLIERIMRSRGVI